jgi:hypothetical protein
LRRGAMAWYALIIGKAIVRRVEIHEPGVPSGA